MTPTMDRTRLDEVAAVEIERWRERVERFARELHANPETAFEEHRSAAAAAGLLAEAGFTVQRPVAGLETAFVAEYGSGTLTVAICIEYDALPGVGHACGHNLIAGASVATALALAPHADALGITIRAIGTPAEEHGGGKSLLIDRGVFDGAGLAIMMHPMKDGMTYNPAGVGAQAVGRYRAVFTGRAAHAAAAPHMGVNAGDAATLSLVAIGLLRQQIPGDHRIAAIVKEAGEVTNIIPEHAVVEFECRAFTLPEYEALLERVRNCFAGAALATGTDLSIEATEPLYEPLVQDPDLAAHWSDVFASFGYDVTETGEMAGGSTDMGNVSQVIPSLHPWVSIPGVDVPIHSHDFAAAADTEAAYALMFQAAQAMVITIGRAAIDPEQRDRFIRSSLSRFPERETRS